METINIEISGYGGSTRGYTRLDIEDFNIYGGTSKLKKRVARLLEGIGSGSMAVFVEGFKINIADDVDLWIKSIKNEVRSDSPYLKKMKDYVLTIEEWDDAPSC